MVRLKQGICFGSTGKPVVENKSEGTFGGSGVVKHGVVVMQHVSNGAVEKVNLGAGIERQENILGLFHPLREPGAGHKILLKDECVVDVDEGGRQLGEGPRGFKKQTVAIAVLAPVTGAAAALFHCKSKLLQGRGSPLVDEAIGCRGFTCHESYGRHRADAVVGSRAKCVHADVVCAGDVEPAEFDVDTGVGENSSVNIREIFDCCTYVFTGKCLIRRSPDARACDDAEKTVATQHERKQLAGGRSSSTASKERVRRAGGRREKDIE